MWKLLFANNLICYQQYFIIHSKIHSAQGAYIQSSGGEFVYGCRSIIMLYSLEAKVLKYDSGWVSIAPFYGVLHQKGVMEMPKPSRVH